MLTFIVAGALYLVGVAVVLVIKPSFMFTPDGNWKEFGIGQSEARYTTFPFWLFCLIWAVLSYIIVLMLLPLIYDEDNEPVYTNSKPRKNGNNTNNSSRNKKLIEESDLVFDDEVEEAPVLRKGYYVLNKKASRLAGSPKYIYMGEED
jgi:hypothetical protein